MTDTITIENQPVLEKGQPTAQGVLLMSMIHEARGMGCWHESKSAYHTYPDNEVCFDVPVYLLERSFYACPKCLKLVDRFVQRANPSYLTSLDALRPIWDKILLDECLEANYSEVLAFINVRDKLNFWEAYPHHHCEALARVLTVECGVKGCMAGRMMLADCEECPTCKGKGTRTVLEAWLKERGV